MRVRTITFAVFIVIVGAGAVNNLRGRSTMNAAADEAQDTAYLDRRISALEQRLIMIESNVSRLNQQATSQQLSPAQPVRDPELALIRSEVELLMGRAREVECGLVHLDERTLSAQAKEARKSAGAQSKDPCRLNPETPVQLSTHQ